MLSDVWHCRPHKDIHYNTNHTFPNHILPILDQTLSCAGALVNLVLITAIVVQHRNRGSTFSSIFYLHIYLANLAECANSLLIYENTRHRNPPKVSDFLIIASGVQDIIHFARIGFMLPLYLVRLLHVVAPIRAACTCRCQVGARRVKEIVYCVCVWTLGVGVGAVRTYARTRTSSQEDSTMQKISFYLMILNLVTHTIGWMVPPVTIACVVRAARRYRAQQDNSTPDLTPSTESRDLHSVFKSALRTLVGLYLVDLILKSYLILLTALTLKINHDPACYPALFVTIRNYLGSPTNFVYSYHSVGVLYGIVVCLVLNSNRNVTQTVVYIFNQGRVMVSSVIRKIRLMLFGYSYSDYYV